MHTLFFRIVLITLLFVPLQNIISQTNQTDPKGLKQGEWKKYYEGGKTPKYEGQFKDNQPIGVFKYYYPSGKIRTILTHKNTKTSYAKDFDANGKLLAEGKFTTEKRDSTWIYYQYVDKQKKTLTIEDYKAGKKVGIWKTFYADGKSLAREVPYTNDKKNGTSKQYYESGKLKVSMQYVNDKAEGKFTSYFPNAKIAEIGMYKGNMRAAKWQVFTIEGKLDHEETYRNGQSNRRKLEDLPKPIDIQELETPNR